jgi:hypothetical protein
MAEKSLCAILESVPNSNLNFCFGEINRVQGWGERQITVSFVIGIADKST